MMVMLFILISIMVRVKGVFVGATPVWIGYGFGVREYRFCLGCCLGLG